SAVATAQFNVSSTQVHLCGATTDHTGLPDSNGVCTTDASTSPTLSTDDNVTFDWSDYLATSKDDAEQGAAGSAATSAPGTEARVYHVQVGTAPSFSAKTVIDDVYVDQTTFTSVANTYPDGPIYWRVQAIDGTKNPLSWSATASFTKVSVPPRLATPADGAKVVETPPLTWAPTDNTLSYNVEVYRATGATVFNASDQVLSANTVRTSWTFTKPLPPGTYVWRLQRVDAQKRTSPWSAVTPADAPSFTVTPSAFDVSAPSDSANLRPTNYTFSWPANPDAATYRFERRQPNVNSVAETQTTPALSWAPVTFPPNGTTWQWRVVPVDNAGNDLAASPWRTFSFVSGPTASGVTVEGAPQVGGSLKADPPAWSGVSGTVDTTFQWYYSSVSASNMIAGADGAIYHPVASDKGKRVLVVATGTSPGYSPGTAESTLFTIGKGAPPQLATPIVLWGSGKVGTVLTGYASWASTGVTTTYQWLRDGRTIPGATGGSYTVTTADFGHTLTLQATGTPSDPAYDTAVVTSNAVVALAGSNLITLIRPSISGSVKLGATVFANHGTWTNSPTKYTYQWYRNGAAIGGADTMSYRIASKDVGHKLTVRVTAMRSGYGDGHATTAAATPPKVTTTVLARMSPSLVKVHHRAKVVATIFSTGLSGPTGTVQVFVGGRKRASKVLRAGALGKITITLPKLGKGKHKVQVRYLGSSITKASRSKNATLTVY
ncbi:MAG TPA: Ig-like domain repeat protein, partial [Marmoricola sp.]